MTKLTRAIVGAYLLGGVLSAGALTGPSPAAGQTTNNPPLEARVPVMTAADFVRQRTSLPKLLVFDVRERGEFLVSRIEGAMHMSPAQPRDEFLRRVASRAKGATVVFYCSLGVRSGDIAQSVYHSLIERGASEVYILQDGIIGWHNEGRSLVNRRGPTRFIHPFDETLKARLKQPEFARMQPE